MAVRTHTGRGCGAAAVAVGLCFGLNIASAQTVRFVNGGLATGASDGTSWANAYRGSLALQAALSAAQPGDQIWVASGTYKPAAAGAPVTSTFDLRSGVGVFGGFDGTEATLGERDVAQNSTVLSGNLDGVGLGDVRHVVTATGLDATAAIDGFTITFGNAVGSTTSFDLLGGGMLVNGGSPAIRNCTFESNKATRGGGLALVNASSAVDGCTFGVNAATSGACAANLSSNGVFTRCVFAGDLATAGGATGAGIYSAKFLSTSGTPSLSVDDCSFSLRGSQFGCANGIAIFAGLGQTSIRGSRFLDNFSCGAGAIQAQGVVEIDRCVFIGNEGTFDGGAAIHSASGEVTVTNSLFAGNDREGISTITAGTKLTLVNCTLAFNGNTVQNIAGGGNHFVIAKQNAQVFVQNCIIWGNLSKAGSASAVVSNAGSIKPRFDSSIVQNWGGLPVQVEGTNSFSTDPLFRSPLGIDGVAGTMDDDLRLMSGSPAIDRGENTFVTMNLDLDGFARRRDDPAKMDFSPLSAPQVDLGAYEFVPVCAGDLNADGFVDDTDFVAFAGAYDLLDCGDAGMPQGCPADLSGDGFVDDADFVLFAAAYDALICP